MAVGLRHIDPSLLHILPPITELEEALFSRKRNFAPSYFRVGFLTPYLYSLPSTESIILN